METLEVVPDPVCLVEAMRAVGYTVESAVADIVDNSISAGARRVSVRYEAGSHPYVAIFDDGRGMDAAELTQAMRHGSSNPSDRRDPKDLGRFGLGLKTASLSQCRRMTVISRREGVTSARQWDLDVVQQSGKWLVVVPAENEIRSLPMFHDLDQSPHGTLVVWQSLDRLVAGAADPQAEMTAKFAPLLEHLALVFHRFAQREDDAMPVAISVNGQPLPLRDPFLKAHPLSQPLEGEPLRDVRGEVKVQPYLLPPLGRLGPEEVDRAGGGDGLRGTQGFYIYRGRRLVIWGTWFRLVPKREAFKLTRVQVDVPNTFDDLWALDIKKSAAHPPDFIRNRLRELVPHFARQGERVITFPGRKRRSPGFVALWQRIDLPGGAIRYELNADHPLVEAIGSQLDDGQRKAFQVLLALAGDALPLETIYADMCGDSRNSRNDSLEEGLKEIAASLMEITGFSLNQVLGIDPLVRYPESHDQLRKEMSSVD